MIDEHEDITRLEENIEHYEKWQRTFYNCQLCSHIGTSYAIPNSVCILRDILLAYHTQHIDDATSFLPSGGCFVSC